MAEAGGSRQVKRHLRKIRPQLRLDSVQCYETPPVYQGQLHSAKFPLP